MYTEPVQTRRLGPGDLDEVVRVLRAGGLVALPTETVYGLAGRALDDECVRAIFRAKGRPQDNPVIVHVASPADAMPLWRFESAAAPPRGRARALLAAFAPGPITVVADKSGIVSDVVTAGLSKVAVRVPAHDVFLRVLSALGEPLAAPSANASGRPSPTTADDVLASLDGRIDAVVDGGPCAQGIESTVVDVSGAAPVILRPGALSAEAVRRVLPDVRAPAPDRSGAAPQEASPGLRHRHYAPLGKRVAVVDDVAGAWPGPAALLVRASTRAALGTRVAPLEVLPDDVGGYGRGLYAALYRLERSGAADVVIEAVPAGDAWDAVRDRVRRAALG